MHPALGAVAVIGGLVLFGLAVLNDLATRAASARVAGEARALQVAAQQLVELGETLKPLGMLDAMLVRWRARQEQVHAGMQKPLDVTEAISNITKAVRLGLQIVILGIGAWLVLRGQLTSGGMIATSIILGRALSPVERALGAWRSWVSARTARGNLVALFEAMPEREARMPLPAPTGRLSLEGVRYAPPGTAEPILQGIDLQIEPGTTCGILGPSGSGKSTLCRLIVGAWAPSAGHVRLDGADVWSWACADLGRHVGYLPQQIDLFPGTVAENIARMGEVDPERVARAARQADVHDMILRLPEGYDTDVGALGTRLSGGQRQRIGLARALYGDPMLVVLDEPNSSLDGAGEQALAQALTELKRLGRTILIVAHQPGALRTADTLLVMRNGMVGAYGPRDEILKQLMVHQPRPAAGPAPTASASPAQPTAAHTQAAGAPSFATSAFRAPAE
jgi:PrtD family type I secretion system ABC transporter